MILPYLADEETTDLAPLGYPNTKFVWRPPDITDKARWSDKCIRDNVRPTSAEGMFLFVKMQAIRIEGDLGVEVMEGGKIVERPFDVQKDMDRFPFNLVLPLYQKIEERSTLSEGIEKNSERPSDSPVTSPTAS